MGKHGDSLSLATHFPTFREATRNLIIMASEKRPASGDYSNSQMVVKKQNLGNNSKAVAVVNGSAANGALIQAVPRTTGLQAPVMELSGHSGEVFCAKFDPNGNYIASGSMDRTIMLWRTFGNCENYGTLTGHKGAIMDLHWSRDSRVLFSASADMHLASWDLETGTRRSSTPWISAKEERNCSSVDRTMVALVFGTRERNQQSILSRRNSPLLRWLWQRQEMRSTPVVSTTISRSGI